MSGASETRIQSWILAKLKERYPEWLFDRQNVAAVKIDEERFVRAGTKGQADIRGCCRGLYVELEVKRLGEKQTTSQKKRQANVERAGGIYAVVHNPTEAFAVVDSL